MPEKIDHRVDSDISLRCPRNWWAMQASTHPRSRPFPPSVPEDLRPDCTTDGLGRLAKWHIEHAGDWQRYLRVPEHDVEDILQDAFVVMLTKAGTLNPVVLESWLRGVVRNKAKHYLRARAIANKLEPLLRARLGDPQPPFPAPDAAVVQRQAIFAVFWLVEQVHECRREVVERHLLDDEPLPQIAASMGEQPGTTFARWQSAKEDMRAAVERERKKQGSARWLVMLAALVECLWLWLIMNGRRLRGAAAVLGGRALGRRLESRRDREKSAELPERGRSRLGALLACTLLPLALVAHEAVRPLEAETPSIAASMRPLVRYLTTARIPASLDHGEDRARSADTPSVDVPSREASSRSENTGREGEKTAVVPSRAKSIRAAPPPKAGSPDSLSSADAEMARHLLVVATTSYQAGRVAIAEAALKQYRRMFPENPYPALYTRAARAERSR